jgi:hypothetical protein
MTDVMRLFPGVPLVESPIFETVLDHIALTPEERTIAQSLNRNGYAVFDFPDEKIEARIESIRERLAPEFSIENNDPAGPERVTIGRIQDAWKSDEDVRAIAANKHVIELLSKLWGRRAFPFQTLNFPIGTQQHAHTDTVHFSSIPERFMCGVWLAMEDIHADSGPLRYVPGSHKWPIINNAMIGRRGWKQELESAQLPYHDAWNALMAEHGARFETFLPKKGEALIWCANLLHGGSPQTDLNRSRWSQVTHYYFEDCVYYTPALSDEPLGRLELRPVEDATNGTARPSFYLGEEICRPEPAQPRPQHFWQRIFR